MNEQTTTKVGYVSPLKRICMTIGELPTSYLESMTYYEMLVWFTNFLQKTAIPTINNNAEAVQELQNLYEDLRQYVNNYFDNLDVQEEINNKLDQMLEDGDLEQIIEQFLQSTAMWCFDTVADMIDATNLVNGSYAKTLGYYAINDGGEGVYKISSTYDANKHYETLDSGLYANLISNNSITLEQCGVQPNEDVSSILQTCLNNYEEVYVNGNGYLLNVPIRIPANTKLTGKKYLAHVSGTINNFHFKWNGENNIPMFTTISGENITSFVYDDYPKAGWGITNISVDGNNSAGFGFVLCGQRNCEANNLIAVNCKVGISVSRSWEIHLGNLYTMYNTLGFSTVPSCSFNADERPTWDGSTLPDTAVNNISIDNLCIRQCKNGAYFNLFAQSSIGSFNIEECANTSKYALWLAYCSSFFQNVHIETTDYLMNQSDYTEVKVFGYLGSTPTFGELQCTSIYSEIPFLINTLVCYAVSFNNNSKRVKFTTNGVNANKPKVLCYSRIDLTNFNTIEYLPRLNPPQVNLIKGTTNSATILTCGNNRLQILLYNGSNSTQPAVTNGITLQQKHGGSISVNIPEMASKTHALLVVNVPYGSTGYGNITATLDTTNITNTDLDIMIGTDIAGIINTYS